MSDGGYDERFRERLLDATAWEETASQLLAAAELLEPKVREFSATPGFRPGSDTWRGWADEFVAIYFMLVAYAIENLLKARIVTANQDEFRLALEASPKIPSALRSHDLCSLAERAGKSGLASGYADILKRLGRSATWYGRYPVPVHSQGLDPFTKSPDGDPISLTSYSSSDLKEIKRVLSELEPSAAAQRGAV